MSAKRVYDMTKALSLKLTGQEMAQLTKHDTRDAEAYQLALLGDYFLENTCQALSTVNSVGSG